MAGEGLIPVPELIGDVEWRLDKDCPCPSLELETTGGLAHSGGILLESGERIPSLLLVLGEFSSLADKSVGLLTEVDELLGEGTLLSWRGFTTVPSERSITGNGS